MSDTIVVTVTSEGGAAGVVQTQAPVMTRQEMEQMKRVKWLAPSEALECTKIHSISGLLAANTALVTTRPFRSPPSLHL